MINATNGSLLLLISTKKHTEISSPQKSVGSACPIEPSYRTDSYGKNSIILGAINSWNKTQHQFSNLSFKAFRPNKLKVYFSKNALESINEEVKGVIFIKETSLL